MEKERKLFGRLDRYVYIRMKFSIYIDKTCMIFNLYEYSAKQENPVSPVFVYFQSHFWLHSRNPTYYIVGFFIGFGQRIN